MPYFSDRYPAAAMNVGPLLVTISAMLPHWQRISSNLKSLSLLAFFPKRASLVAGSQGTMGLNEIEKLIHNWHDHGVDMNLAEKSRNVGNHWGKMKMKCLPSLERMEIGRASCR